MSKRTLFKSAMAVTLTALLLAVAGCGPDPFYIEVSSIEGVPETGTAGIPLTLTGTIRPAFASNKNIVWSVVDAGTTGASISGNILNTAASGTVIIRATVADGMAKGKAFTQDFLIYIVDGDTGGGETVPVTGVTLNRTTLTMTVGGTATLTATVTPSNATNKNVTWSSNEEGVATVTDNGIVTAHAADTVTITVTTVDGGFTAECEVTVLPAGTPIYGISLSETETHVFASATVGYAEQDAYTVTITNTGNEATGSLSIALSGANSSSFTLSETSIANIAVGGTDTFTVSYNPSLPVGTYTATVTVSGNNGISANFTVSFRVNGLDPTYSIGLSHTGTYTFTSADYGYSAQSPHTLTITNTGNQATGALGIALSGANAGSFTSATSMGSIAVDGTGTFTVVPKIGLAVGTYTATVTVSGSNSISAAFSVSFTVNKATGAAVGTPTVSGSPTTDSITVNAATLVTATGQSIEYAILTVNNGSPSTWQSGTTFTGLTASTTYYVYARSASNANYNAGTASVSVGIATASGGTGGEITSSTGIVMVSILGGTFMMGSLPSEPDRAINETPHFVTLTQSFYMGKYQVTQEQYQAVMGSNPSNFTSAVTEESGTPGKLPVENVSWYDALVFCNKLSVLEGLDPVYSIGGSTDPAVWGNVPTGNNTTWNGAVMDKSKNGYRLPTEAEWEYACRAGTTTAYNMGDTFSDNTGWYYSNSGSKTHQVGLKQANAWGLYDMHGNVMEWCWDWYGSYASGAQTDPTGAVTDTDRVYRGGHWNNYASILRSAYRGYYVPNTRSSILGFRLVRPNGDGDSVGTAPTITTTSLTGGTVGTTYSQTLTATGTTPITWSVDSGALPTGLNLVPATGVISGTPTAAGTFNFTVKASNSAGSGTKALSIVIAASGGTNVNVSTASDFYAKVASFEFATTDMTITVTSNLTLTDLVFIPAPATDGITLTIKGNTAARKLTRGRQDLTSGWGLFIVKDKARLAFESIVVDGNKDTYNTLNTASLVRVDSGGTFTMNTGAVLQNNCAQNGCVNVGDGGMFIMDGGEISGNTRSETVTFGGGGVYSYGTFTMNGGTISGNTATSNGGGVYIGSGTFTMNGGTISGNTTTSNGGGVYVNSSGTFRVGGTAKVSGNTKTDNTTNNVYLASGRYITLGTGDNAPKVGMDIHVQTATSSGIIVNSGANGTVAAYFKADEAGKTVVLSGSQLVIQ